MYAPLPNGFVFAPEILGSNNQRDPMQDIYGTLRHLGLDTSDSDEVNHVQRRRQNESKRDWDFVQAQLVPASYLCNGKWKDLRPESFVVYLKQAVQVALEDASFYIQPKRDKSYFEPEYFVVKVLSPSGQRVRCQVVRDHLCPLRLRYFFRPVESGRHIVHVNLGVHEVHPIDGSPLKLEICRNYGK